MIKEIPEYKGYYATTDGKIYSDHTRRCKKGLLSFEERPSGMLARLQIGKVMYREYVANIIARTFTGKTPKYNEELVYRDGDITNCSLTNIFYAPTSIMRSIESRLAICIKTIENTLK